ncbi:helix-turn-helix transcriptional regulator [Streptomyces sp. PCS3-D2]|uniref:helix-turn-helix domain-containing protein n=1 Tax=Streptomyces sp. PCS3-D2 TaxID=1460244 RepID=UPI0004516B69|nr:helix-turn-helix transcriptional regulator [Streptomyces sp. PCS3-D2]WKV74762.1 helix-turn-helix transcriptional regulator [Streptomyces sp. PCS3-D2]
MSPSEPLYRLLNVDLLKTLMERTGSGQKVTIRELAANAGCSSTTVGRLVSGEKECIVSSNAHAIATAIGVDVLILFAPAGRSVPVPHREATVSVVRAAG